MTGVAHNSSKRCSPAQRATTLFSCLRVQIMGGVALSNPVVRTACMHNSAIWARARLISFLGFRLA
jgi:hypothetical protein